MKESILTKLIEKTICESPWGSLKSCKKFCGPMSHFCWSSNENGSILCFIIWLVPWAGKMNQILHCDWLPKWARCSYLACSGLPLMTTARVPQDKLPREPYNKSFNDQAFSVKIYGLLTKCEVKMAGYWPISFFLRVYGPRLSRSP